MCIYVCTSVPQYLSTPYLQRAHTQDKKTGTRATEEIIRFSRKCGLIFTFPPFFCRSGLGPLVCLVCLACLALGPLASLLHSVASFVFSKAFPRRWFPLLAWATVQLCPGVATGISQGCRVSSAVGMGQGGRDVGGWTTKMELFGTARSGQRDESQEQVIETI